MVYDTSRNIRCATHVSDSTWFLQTKWWLFTRKHCLISTLGVALLVIYERLCQESNSTSATLFRRMRIWKETIVNDTKANYRKQVGRSVASRVSATREPPPSPRGLLLQPQTKHYQRTAEAEEAEVKTAEVYEMGSLTKRATAPSNRLSVIWPVSAAGRSSLWKKQHVSRVLNSP